MGERTRSPAYPVVDLEEAIERWRTLYEKESRHLAPIEAVLSHWGYETSSGNGLRVIAALKQFGLADEDKSGPDRKIRLSRLAMEILKPDHEGSKNHMAVLREAALHPKIYLDIWEKYDGSLPSDRTLERYLELERDFNPNFVDRFIQKMRASFELAKLGGADTIDQDYIAPANEESNIWPKEPMAATSMMPAYASSGIMRDFPLTLPSLEVATIRLPVPMSEEDFDTLVSSLQSMKRSLLRSTDSKDDDEYASPQYIVSNSR